MTWSRQFTTLKEIPEEHKQSFLSLPEASRLSTIPYDHLRRAIVQGELEVLLSGVTVKRPLIRVDRLRAWIAANTVLVGVPPKAPRPRLRCVAELPRERGARRKLLKEAALGAYDAALSEHGYPRLGRS